MKTLISTIKDSMYDIKYYWAEMKNVRGKKEKSKYFSLVHFNAFFLFLFSLLIVITVTFIVLSLFYGFYVLLGLVVTIPLLLIAMFIRNKAYVRFKEHYIEYHTED
ncbi:hypothetical protein AB3N04_09750 [Alkalihalophilus sp. As8PL]|uniref:Uncharacterized protein n=1 Tax=Alkalihalophilus sp. As8PL TaxID=3237103 RepID=A0AB39BXY0_9BACI